MPSGFNEACDRIKTIERINDDQKLTLYGLYKQANIGDINESKKPSSFDIKSKAKFKAWQKNKGKTQEEAMTQYTDIVNNLLLKKEHD